MKLASIPSPVINVRIVHGVFLVAMKMVIRELFNKEFMNLAILDTLISNNNNVVM